MEQLGRMRQLQVFTLLRETIMRLKQGVGHAAACTMVLGLLSATEAAEATTYHYAANSGTPFLFTVFHNDAIFAGGNGRPQFAIDYRALDISITADDVSDTVTIEGALLGSYNFAASDRAADASYATLVNGVYTFEITYHNAQVFDPLVNPFGFIVKGGEGGSATGSISVADARPLFLLPDNSVPVAGKDFAGLPPNSGFPYPQAANYMLALAANPSLGGHFALAGWLETLAPLKAGGAGAFISGDIASGTVFYLGRSGSSGPGGGGSEIPEPATVLLLGSALAGGFFRRKIA